MTDPVAGLRALLVSTSAGAGRAVNVDQVLRGLQAAAAAFTRRSAAPATAAADRRRDHRRVATAARALEDALGALNRKARAELDPWDSAVEFEAWRDRLARLCGQAERVAGAPSRRGGRRDEATRRMALEVALVLAREGLPLSTYEDGVFAQAARLTAALAGRALPADENIRRVLRPAVRLFRRQGVIESPAGGPFDDLTKPTPDPALSVQKRMAH